MADKQRAPNTMQVSRREAIGAMGMVGALTLIGCGGGGGSSATTATATATGNASTTTSTTSTSSNAGSCVIVPSDEIGPFPLLAVLSNTAMVRSDITEGKTGVPLTLVVNLQNVNNLCAPITNASVYIWHCDKDGSYSGYTNQTGGISTVGQTFLRGIQDTDSNGQVTFTTIYPGWYAGRITHIHFQIYLYSSSTATATSQIAFNESITTAVYNSPLYAGRGQNTSIASNAADHVFSDGTTYQMPTFSGDTKNGYVATLNIGIAA